MAGKAQLHRLTIEQGAAELRCDRRTLAKQVKSAGVLPGTDGLYSIFDLVGAHFGDIHGEVLRKTREEADKLALANEKERGRLLDAEAVYKHYEGAFVVCRQKLLASELSDEGKDELLTDLRALKTKIFNGQ
jgi:hypothetical protein